MMSKVVSRLNSMQHYAFCLKACLPSLVFALLMLCFYPNTGWDALLSNQFFDRQQQQFVFMHQPFLSHVMHTGLKWLMVGIAITSLLLAILAIRIQALKQVQRPLLWSFLGMVLASSAVALLKHYSLHGCPWDLTMYGGDLPYLPLFAHLPAGVEAGECFPAGHPSGGFALTAFYFAFRQIKPRFAKMMLWLGMTMGLLMGFAQVMRGAHFLSHVLWSGWVVWVVLLMLYALWKPEKLK